MKAVADAIGVARSNLAVQAMKQPPEPCGADAVRKASGPDAVDVYPQDRRRAADPCYRRLAALVNRELTRTGQAVVNRKRALRICQANDRVLACHTGNRAARTHDGVVIALRSNIRWCSDHLELKCRNGDVVRVLFVIYAFDREIIAWSAVAHAGISG